MSEKLPKNQVTCWKCGKEISLSARKAVKQLQCPHCGAKMVLDIKSDRRFRYFRILFMILIALGMTYGFEEITNHQNYIPIAIILVFMVAIVNVGDDFCLWILYKTFGINYMDPKEFEASSIRRKGKRR